MYSAYPFFQNKLKTWNFGSSKKNQDLKSFATFKKDKAYCNGDYKKNCTFAKIMVYYI